jgi:hypothetical protein
MSFREKSAWVTFVLLLVTFVIYFGSAFTVLHGRGHIDNQPSPNLFHLFFQLVFWFVVLEIVMHILIAARTPKDANAPLDEREKLIALKSMQPAFYVLLVGAFLAIGTLHLGTTTYHMAHSVLFVVWIAELVRYGMQLYYFRRGA